MPDESHYILLFLRAQEALRAQGHSSSLLSNLTAPSLLHAKILILRSLLENSFCSRSLHRRVVSAWRSLGPQSIPRFDLDATMALLSQQSSVVDSLAAVAAAFASVAPAAAPTSISRVLLPLPPLLLYHLKVGMARLRGGRCGLRWAACCAIDFSTYHLFIWCGQ